MPPKFEQLNIAESVESFEVVQHDNQNSRFKSEPISPPVSKLAPRWDREPEPRKYLNQSNENSSPVPNSVQASKLDQHWEKESEPRKFLNQNYGNHNPNQNRSSSSVPSNTHSQDPNDSYSGSIPRNRRLEYNENDYSDQYQNSESKPDAQQKHSHMKTQNQQTGSYPRSDVTNLAQYDSSFNSDFKNYPQNESDVGSDSRSSRHTIPSPAPRTSLLPKSEPDGMFTFKEMREQLSEVAQEPVKSIKLEKSGNEKPRPAQENGTKVELQLDEKSAKNPDIEANIPVEVAANVSVKEMAEQIDKTAEKVNEDNISKRLRSSNPENGRQNPIKTEESKQRNPAADSKSSKGKPEPKVVEPPKKTTLASYNHRHEESDIQVTFEVLLSSEMALYGRNVYIAFGPPLSNWNTVMVEMRQKEGTPAVFAPGNYFYLTGVLPLNKDYKCRSIPYKYIVKDDRGDIVWEFIDFNKSYTDINRCLVVPDKVQTFTKFDDVILPKLSSKDRSASQLQKIGREVAVKWMLPRPRDFDNPDFDFEAILTQFNGAVKTFGNNGTRICEGNDPKGSFNPHAFYIESNVVEQVKKVFGQFKIVLKENDLPKILRFSLYLCLISTTKYLDITQLDQFLPFFEAFKLCGDLLFDAVQLPKSIEGEIQNQITGALKNLVKDFVNLQANAWGQDCSSRGNWIYAMPFIHRWDLSGEKSTDWLRLETWKQNLRSR